MSFREGQAFKFLEAGKSENSARLDKQLTNNQLDGMLKQRPTLPAEVA
jgi:hypothetical protein